jgi:2-polyprenyl-6-methoxyphenol hydroxylase-like FAD-dependent oxidoreductase
VDELRFDVVVAGGGPAGSGLALRLARAGFSVAVVEARRFPRFKPCGEFMSPACLPLLRELGVLERVRALGPREVRGMRLHAHGRRALGRFVDVGCARRSATVGRCGASASTSCSCAPPRAPERRCARESASCGCCESPAEPSEA